VVDLVFCSVSDGDNIAHLYVKHHPPGLTPLDECIKIFLQEETGFHDISNNHQQRRIGEDTFSVISLINMRNNRGPKTVPCGTPDKTGAACDM